MQTLNTMQTDTITGGAIESTETMKIEKLKDEGSSNSGGSGDLGAQTVIVGVGAALGRINPWVGVAGTMLTFYMVESPRMKGVSSYPSYQGGPHQIDPLL